MSTIDLILTIANPIIIIFQAYIYSRMMKDYKTWLVEEREKANDYMFKWIEEKYHNGKIMDFGKVKE